jgi:hypothetical protein
LAIDDKPVQLWMIVKVREMGEVTEKILCSERSFTFQGMRNISFLEICLSKFASPSRTHEHTYHQTLGTSLVINAPRSPGSLDFHSIQAQGGLFGYLVVNSMTFSAYDHTGGVKALVPRELICLTSMVGAMSLRRFLFVEDSGQGYLLVVTESLTLKAVHMSGYLRSAD